MDNHMDNIMDNHINAYLKQLSDKEKKAYDIAKTQLGSSFNVVKSVGFIKFLKNNC